MSILNIAAPRVVVGGLTGLVVFSVDAVATLIRFVLTPPLAERATAGSFLAMLAFLFLFIAAGALAGYLWGTQVRFLRHVAIGALVGAMLWSYLTATWSLTARPTAISPPQMSVLSAALVGAGGGALGGLLLFAIDGLRRLIHGRR